MKVFGAKASPMTDENACSKLVVTLTGKEQGSGPILIDRIQVGTKSTQRLQDISVSTPTGSIMQGSGAQKREEN